MHIEEFKRQLFTNCVIWGVSRACETTSTLKNIANLKQYFIPSATEENRYMSLENENYMHKK